MTSGASDEPPMPARTMWVTPSASSCSAERLDLGDEGARDRDRLGPAEALRRLGLGLGAPQRGVLRRDAARDEVGDEAGHGAADGVGGVAAHRDAEAHRAASSAPRTVSRSSFHETMNLSTPSLLEHVR